MNVFCIYNESNKPINRSVTVDCPGLGVVSNPWDGSREGGGELTKVLFIW